jgi:hypothetical protein
MVMKAKLVNQVFKPKSKEEIQPILDEIEKEVEEKIKICKKIIKERVNLDYNENDIEFWADGTMAGTPKLDFKIQGYQNRRKALFRGNDSDIFTKILNSYLAEFFNSPKGKKDIINILKNIQKALKLSEIIFGNKHRYHVIQAESLIRNFDEEKLRKILKKEIALNKGIRQEI